MSIIEISIMLMVVVRDGYVVVGFINQQAYHANMRY